MWSPVAVLTFASFLNTIRLISSASFAIISADWSWPGLHCHVRPQQAWQFAIYYWLNFVRRSSIHEQKRGNLRFIESWISREGAVYTNNRACRLSASHISGAKIGNFVEAYRFSFKRKSARNWDNLYPGPKNLEITFSWFLLYLVFFPHAKSRFTLSSIFALSSFFSSNHSSLGTGIIYIYITRTCKVHHGT